MDEIHEVAETNEEVSSFASPYVESFGEALPTIREEGNMDAAPSPATSVGDSLGKKPRSHVWDHFTKMPSNQLRATCNYCGNSCVADPKKGTSSMLNHLIRCKQNPANIEKNKKLVGLLHTVSRKEVDSADGCSINVGKTVGSWKLNQEAGRKALARMIIVDELPFRFVERDGFLYFLEIIQPEFVVPSRSTVTRDCYGIYLDERRKLKRYFKKSGCRVSLTTDLWTSCQNLSYMCLTGHYIDEDWHLHKKILNFCQVAGHTGELLGKAVERCILDWGIDKILTITVDNASSNDLCIKYLKKRIGIWGGGLLLEGDCLHMRCAAHILNLVVKEGLKENVDSIARVRSCVKYVRSSPAHLVKFKVCVEQVKLSSHKLVSLDVETRWNSTYLMLESALVFKKAFDLLREDDKYVDEIAKVKGTPQDEDWEAIRCLLPFLKIFYEATLRMSGSLYVTGNVYLQEVALIGTLIESCIKDNRDENLKKMAHRMKANFSKYWVNKKNLNLLMFVASVLDPSCKLSYVDWAIDEYFGDWAMETDISCELGEDGIYDGCSSVVSRLRADVRTCLESLYASYAASLSHVCSSKSRLSSVTESDVMLSETLNVEDARKQMTKRFKQTRKNQNNDEKNELQRYLDENLVESNEIISGSGTDTSGSSFTPRDVLGWWRKNESRYPIMSAMAKDVLAMPISTVASESAFSTGGRVLDRFRSSLTGRMVEALVCAQDWLRRSQEPILLEEKLEDLETMEAELEKVSLCLPLMIIDE